MKHGLLRLSRHVCRRVEAFRQERAVSRIHRALRPRSWARPGAAGFDLSKTLVCGMASILAIARQHLSDALSDPALGLPDPGPRWGTLAAWCRRNIARFQSEDDAIHFAQAPLGHGGFEARLTGEALAAHADKLEAMLLRDFPQAAAHFTSFVEPEVSRPETTAIRDGRRVSGPMLVHMLFYFSCATRIPDMDRVCEIGGGYGAPARLFMTNSFCRPRSYIIVDLPESPRPMSPSSLRPLVSPGDRRHRRYHGNSCTIRRAGSRNGLIEEPKWRFNESELDRTITAWPGAWLKRVR